MIQGTLAAWQEAAQLAQMILPRVFWEASPTYFHTIVFTLPEF
jgi:hypothetical protein